jgi:hypothetical protein
MGKLLCMRLFRAFFSAHLPHWGGDVAHDGLATFVYCHVLMLDRCPLFSR